MYFIGLDVHKKTIRYCVKDGAGRVQQEGKIGSTRRELDGWIRTMPQPRTIAMEATIFTGWIYDHQPFTCDGETIVVNRHGALISCTVPLRMELNIEIRVIITDKHASAKVVYVDPQRAFICGIALDKPENIWGLSFPPDDWHEGRHDP